MRKSLFPPFFLLFFFPKSFPVLVLGFFPFFFLPFNLGCHLLPNALDGLCHQTIRKPFDAPGRLPVSGAEAHGPR